MTMACRGDQNCVSHVCEQEEEWDEISLHASGAACTADDPQQQQQQHCTTPTLPYPLERLTAATLVATAQTKEGPAYTGEYGTGQRADSSDDGTPPQEGVGGDQTGRSGSRSPLSRGQDQVRMVEDLLFEIYLNRYRASGRRDSFDSDGYSISSCTSDALPGRSSEYERSNPVRLKRACMETTDIEDLRQMGGETRPTAYRCSTSPSCGSCGYASAAGE
ncbi:PREDICTED: uncharacterized protein LOC106816924 [Priapulus caudatus]|uniref:Uncharacterized protein LOC106816924 n=1 Tax=Priapulus caudatus TaxID=37621 RepID=A0ABM1EXY1_PRICU|nr:PREDICTED: uncharacterized protein LOC106816924 [Priapulus caudatus]